MTSSTEPSGARGPRSLDDLLAGVSKETERVEAPAGFADRVLGRVEREASPRATGPRLVRWLPAGLAAAACAMLATYLLGRDAGERRVRDSETTIAKTAAGRASGNEIAAGRRFDETTSDLRAPAIAGEAGAKDDLAKSVPAPSAAAAVETGVAQVAEEKAPADRDRSPEASVRHLTDSLRVGGAAAAAKELTQAQVQSVAFLAERFPRSFDGCFYAVANIAPEELSAAVNDTSVGNAPSSLVASERMEREFRARAKVEAQQEQKSKGADATREQRLKVPASQGDRLLRLLDHRYPGQIQPAAQIPQAGLYTIEKVPESSPARGAMQQRFHELGASAPASAPAEEEVDVVVFTRPL
ncbi:MAG TPA: hypothetical protein VKE69_06425 [Planctomycetota bacterium]|nr:hypothetical protein [Planctomycetota bacterium]